MYNNKIKPNFPGELGHHPSMHACCLSASRSAWWDIKPSSMNQNGFKKQDAANEPECSHVKHICATSDLNSLVHFSHVTVPVHWRLWNLEEGEVQSVGSEESGVLSGECSVECEVGIVECGVQSVEGGV